MTVIVQAEWKVQPGHADAVLRELPELTAATRAEPGCEDYRILRDRADPDRFVILERYRDESGAAAHAESGHYHRLVIGRIVPILADRQVVKSVVDEVAAATPA